MASYGQKHLGGFPDNRSWTVLLWGSGIQTLMVPWSWMGSPVWKRKPRGEGNGSKMENVSSEGQGSSYQ